MQMQKLKNEYYMILLRDFGDAVMLLDIGNWIYIFHLSMKNWKFTAGCHHHLLHEGVFECAPSDIRGVSTL